MKFPHSSDKLTLLPCGHIYHDLCLQHNENKCLHCLKYIKNRIEINVKSIINYLTREKDLPIENDPENEIQSLEHDDLRNWK